jgi:hypothetical protein
MDTKKACTQKQVSLQGCDCGKWCKMISYLQGEAADASIDRVWLPILNKGTSPQ